MMYKERVQEIFGSDIEDYSENTVAETVVFYFKTSFDRPVRFFELKQLASLLGSHSIELRGQSIDFTAPRNGRDDFVEVLCNCVSFKEPMAVKKIVTKIFSGEF